MTHVDNEVLGHRVACQVRILRIKLSELQSALDVFARRSLCPNSNSEIEAQKEKLKWALPLP